LDIKRDQFDAEVDAYTFVELIVVLFFIFDIVAVFAWLVGIKKLCGIIFYIVSFHWLVKLIIKSKQGNDAGSIVKGGLDEILDNDEEMANHAIDSDHEIEEEMQKIEAEQPKVKGNLLKTRK
jgi:hypothetical protein